MSCSFEITEMRMSDYCQVAKLWRESDGVGMDSDTDSPEGVQKYLQRNPGMCFVARKDGALVGAVLCGHDGRRGYLHHLAVAQTHRRRGLGGMLVERCLCGLRQAGINKCNIFVFGDNEAGNAFWRSNGWNGRTDLLMMQKPTCGGSESGPSRSC